MEQRLKLNTYGERLWTRDLARAIRVQVREWLEKDASAAKHHAELRAELGLPSA